MKKIGIVYFVYANEKKNWRSIVKKQLSDVRKSGIYDSAFFYVVVSNPSKIPHKLIQEFFYQCFDFLDLSEISIHDENKYEYFGIHKLWEVAQSKEHDYLIYFHTKGMSYKDNLLYSKIGIRSIREKVLTYFLFSKYKKKLDIFYNDDSVNKIAFLNNNDDSRCFTWFNFFWIRASYVRMLQEPIVTENRYYYESWNGKVCEETHISCLSDAYSLYYRGKFFCDSDKASDILSRFRKYYKYSFPFSFIYILLTYN